MLLLRTFHVSSCAQLMYMYFYFFPQLNARNMYCFTETYDPIQLGVFKTFTNF